MLKQLKLASTIAALALATIAASPAMGAASSVSEVPAAFWTMDMLKKMDRNKDGMVSRDEYMAYMGQQFDKMDPKKKGMLTSKEFTDKKMMSYTFGVAQSD